MIIHYGYEDGSGRYYVSMDAGKCVACRRCIERCPQQVLTLETIMIDIDDKEVAVVREALRKKLHYTCATCHRQATIHCVLACEKRAIAATWEKK